MLALGSDPTFLALPSLHPPAFPATTRLPFGTHTVMAIDAYLGFPVTQPYPRDERVTHIYLLSDPTGLSQKAYVGMTVDLQLRLKGHLSKQQLGAYNYKAHWLRSLLSRGVTPDMFVLEVVPPEGDYEDAERFWISYFRYLGADLTNLTDGGAGCRGHKQTAEHKRKISRSLSGRTHSPEHTAKVAASNSGKRRTPEYCAHSSASRMGKPVPASTILAMAQARTGKPLTQETKEKISQANLGKPKHSSETRAKLSAINTGKRHSPETLAKMSLSQKIWRENRKSNGH